MNQTFLDLFSKKMILERDCSIQLNYPQWKFYLNGIVEVMVMSVFNNNGEYVCHCIDTNENSVYLTTPEYLFVNKLDTKAAKILYSKGNK